MAPWKDKMTRDEIDYYERMISREGYSAPVKKIDESELGCPACEYREF